MLEKLEKVLSEESIVTFLFAFMSEEGLFQPYQFMSMH